MKNRRARRQLQQAIVELREAQRFLNRNRVEAAEAEIGDALRFIGRSLRTLHPRAPR